ncbi:Sec1-like protein [Artemisia annua]|uniref:Sec1-like protein n=1 Tax=Artemisia annua TaxID=35608 RepID=A0A2U1P6X1_ARTAN|nr:Sec1-like protein [Artemisia annua]
MKFDVFSVFEKASDTKNSSIGAFSLKFDVHKKRQGLRKDRTCEDSTWQLSRFYPMIEQNELPKEDYPCMNDPSRTFHGRTQSESAKMVEPSLAHSMISRRTATWALPRNSYDGNSSDSVLRHASSDFKKIGRRVYVFIVSGATRSEREALLSKVIQVARLKSNIVFKREVNEFRRSVNGKDQSGTRNDEAVRNDGEFNKYSVTASGAVTRSYHALSQKLNIEKNDRELKPVSRYKGDIFTPGGENGVEKTDAATRTLSNRTGIWMYQALNNYKFEFHPESSQYQHVRVSRMATNGLLVHLGCDVITVSSAEEQGNADKTAKESLLRVGIDGAVLKPISVKALSELLEHKKVLHVA